MNSISLHHPSAVRASSRAIQQPQKEYTQMVLARWLKHVQLYGSLDLFTQPGESRKTMLIELAKRLGLTPTIAPTAEALPSAYGEARDFVHNLLPAGFWIGEREGSLYVYEVAFLPLPVA